jgi:hypothetical protein
MRISVRAADAYLLLKKAKKSRTCEKLVKEAVNEEISPALW